MPLRALLLASSLLAFLESVGAGSPLYVQGAKTWALNVGGRAAVCHTSLLARPHPLFFLRPYEVGSNNTEMSDRVRE